MRTTRYRRQASNTWLRRCCAGPPEVRRNTPARTWRARTGTCASRRASGTRSWTTWRRRLTSAQCPPPGRPPGEWDAFMDDVAQTLDKFAVPPAERAEVVAIVESTRADIVV